MHRLFGMCIAITFLYSPLYATADHIDPKNPLKSVTIHNTTRIPFIVGYRRNDPGFRGSHAIVHDAQQVEGQQSIDIQAFSRQSEAGARIVLTAILRSLHVPNVQTEISVRHQDTIRIISHRSHFEICNASRTLQSFLQAFPDESGDDAPAR